MIISSHKTSDKVSLAAFKSEMIELRNMKYLVCLAVCDL